MEFLVDTADTAEVKSQTRGGVLDNVYAGASVMAKAVVASSPLPGPGMSDPGA